MDEEIWKELDEPSDPLKPALVDRLVREAKDTWGAPPMTTQRLTTEELEGITRYNIIPAYRRAACFDADPNGPWVKYDDITSLRSQLAAAQARVGELESQVLLWSDWAASLPH